MSWLTSVVVVVLMFLARAALVVLIILALACLVLGALYLAKGAKAVWVRLRGTERVDQVVFRHGVSYSPGHLWLEHIEADTLRVGLDDLARRLLATPERIELPPEGTVLRRGEDAARVHVGKRVIRIPSPVEGEVVAINDALAETPTLLEKPYSGGWLFAVRSQEPSDDAFRDARAARAWMREEQKRLLGLAEHALGIAAADGGLVLTDWIDRLSAEQRADLATSLLRPKA